ncbi:MAG: response regulator [Pseudomonadota bacterium]
MRSHTVLVVDDDPVQRLLLSNVLERAFRVNVLAARGGVEALKILQRQTDVIDLMLLNLYMPDMDGVEVLMALSETGASPPLALMSSDQHMLHAAAMLANGYGLPSVATLPKPIDLERLGDVVVRAVGINAQLSQPRRRRLAARAQMSLPIGA